MIVKYCENDSIILYQILINFRELVYTNWGIIIENYPTISSLAFAILRKKYLVENMIPITTTKVFILLNNHSQAEVQMFTNFMVKILEFMMLTLYIPQQ